MRCAAAIIGVGFLAAGARADLELPAVFGDGCVMQRDRELPVWGRAAPGELVTVALAGRTAAAPADATGAWSVRLAALPAGGPHRLEVATDGEHLTVRDVLVGEVWIGSGQSNMRWTVEHSDGFDEVRAAADRPTIRMFREDSLHSPDPQWRGTGSWVTCSPETVGDFSAVLYAFGRRLHEETGVPVGLIDSSIGGTGIQSWISSEAQYRSPALHDMASARDEVYRAFDVNAEMEAYRATHSQWKEDVALAEELGRDPPKRPWNRAEIHLRVGGIGHLFNGKIAPLVPYAIRGVVWYQGEANVLGAQYYYDQLPLLVRDWRARWGQGPFPFAWVQLPNYIAPRARADWPMVRDAMRRALCEPNTGMAITIDVGDPHDLHPSDKRPFGERLAAWALGTVYGRTGATSGPLYAAHAVDGAELTVFFTHADGGLVARDGSGLVVRGDEVLGLEVADADGVWHPATGRVEGRRLVVSAAGVPAPGAVRYAWAGNPRCNLYNGAGLPASPFTSEERDEVIARAAAAAAAASEAAAAAEGEQPADTTVSDD